MKAPAIEPARCAVRNAIDRHRSAWQAFQDAQADETDIDTIHAADDESAALAKLLGTIPHTLGDFYALMDHWNWYTIEEEQRRGLNEFEDGPFAVLAMVRLAQREGQGLGK